MNEMPNWLNTTNDHLLVQPRAVRNIENWMKSHPENQSLKEISDGTGYSEEELTVILRYWNKRLTELLEKQEHRRWDLF